MESELACKSKTSREKLNINDVGLQGKSPKPTRAKSVSVQDIIQYRLQNPIWIFNRDNK